MKRIVIMALAALIILPVSSFALGFFNMTNVSITQIGADAYRFRANFEWGGPTIKSSDILTPISTGWVTDAAVGLTAFEMGGISTAYNFYGGLNPGPLVDRENRSEDSRTPVVNQVGFDFTADGSVPQLLRVNYTGQLDWQYRYYTTSRKGLIDLSGVARTEIYQGGYDIRLAPSQIPEPATVLLFGLGMAGVALVSRRRTSK